MTFPPDYFAARDRFRLAADRLGWDRAAIPIDARGPAGEELTIDVALSSLGGPEPLLVLSSGVHGAEGFFGSAVQIDAMEGWAASGPPVGVRCVLVHAVNPFGFAHVRRFDENNVDPNRNFLLPGEEYAGCPPRYAELDAALNPPRPPSRWESFTLIALLAILRYGYADLKQAIAGGQYEFPKGLFFGGRGPSQAHKFLREHFVGWLGDARSAVHLDFHTGLGRWGTYKLLTDPPTTPEQLDRAARWFGCGVVEMGHPAGVAYHIRGGFDTWCATRAAGRDYLALCAEFGTYGTIAVLGGLRTENQAHHWGDGPHDPRTVRAKTRLKELFCPASPRWRRAVLDRSRRIIGQAVAGLQGKL
jgi:hypothetical protein